MKPDKATYDLIERFLAGKLSEKEEKAVLERITTDLEFSKALAFHSRTIKTVKMKAREELKEGLNQQFEDNKAQAVFFRPWYKKPLNWAAILTFLFAGAWLLWPSEVGDKPLFTSYYEMPKASFDRDQADLSEQRWSMAMKPYIEKNWASASEELEALAVDSSFEYPSRAYFYLGASLLEEGKNIRARKAWGEVSPMSRFGEEAEWNIVMSFLKENRDAQVKRELEKILEKPEHGYYQKAQGIMKEL